MFDLHRVCAAPILRRLWMLLSWTPLAILSSKFRLVCIILSLFSSKAGSSHVAGEGAAPERLSSESVGALWPEISSAGNMDIGGSFVAAARSNLEVLTSRPVSSAGRVSTERSSCGHGSALLDWALEQSHVPGSSHGVGRGCGSGSTKNKATRILVWI
jgi:hypothetical protein